MNKAIAIRPSSTLLWITILAGPVAFIVDFQSRYALVEWACENHRDWVLRLIAVTALVAALASTWLAWTAFTRLHDEFGRARFMAMSGFILSAVFAMTIIANELPHFFIGSCD